MNNPFSKLTFILFTIFFAGLYSPDAEEGMYPLSEIHKLDLVNAGLKINPKEIYNPDGISLIDALVNIGGCTGSFVSDKGLIITNHHCAFGAISSASTVENNFLENGFYAKSIEEEIPAAGYKCRITDSYEDVSKIILAEANKFSDPIKRGKIISDKIAELEKKYSDRSNSIEARVSEMFAGQTYILFKYKVIEDVRLVFAPPRSIGEFGGETDNWVWPRHTGDFSFMRAYVAPDGSSKSYDKNNVPYKPKKFLKINQNGVQENDFVFILGYPGRTFRNYPSQYLKYQEDYLLPFTSELFEYVINTITEASKNDEAMQLKYSSYIKGLANTMKNYKGKIKGMKKINLTEKKHSEDLFIKDYISKNPELTKKYGDVFDKIEFAYQQLDTVAMPVLWFERTERISDIYQIYNFIFQNSRQMLLPDSQRTEPFKKDNYQHRLKSIRQAVASANQEISSKVLSYLFNYTIDFAEHSRLVAVDRYLKNDEKTIKKFVDDLIEIGILDTAKFESMLKLSPKELRNLHPIAFQLFQELNRQKEEVEKTNSKISAELKMLMPLYTDAKQEWNNRMFIPDANSTLRLTYGHVKGYSPADALYCKPFTTIDGVIEKSFLGGEYELPEKFYDLYEQNLWGKFFDKKIGSVPVALLYNTDTTGGNSGSPILNAYGELIGVNFDRTFEATINDFVWNESYSRSIGVDIRYVLWVTSAFSGADKLLDEMKIKL